MCKIHYLLNQAIYEMKKKLQQNSLLEITIREIKKKKKYLSLDCVVDEQYFGF
jgi:hypothetical protein